jgi:hypothetical protein
MNRCSDCNSLLTKEETVCVECGAAVVPLKPSSMNAAGVLKICFYLSILYLIATMFVLENQSAKLAFMICCGLLFASRSAEQGHMIKRR